MIGGRAKGDNELHYSSSKGIHQLHRGTGAEMALLSVPDCTATSIRQWIRTAPERRHDFGRSNFLQPRQSTRKADT